MFVAKICGSINFLVHNFKKVKLMAVTDLYSVSSENNVVVVVTMSMLI